LVVSKRTTSWSSSLTRRVAAPASANEARDVAIDAEARVHEREDAIARSREGEAIAAREAREALSGQPEGSDVEIAVVLVEPDRQGVQLGRANALAAERAGRDRARHGARVVLGRRGAREERCDGGGRVTRPDPTPFGLRPPRCDLGVVGRRGLPQRARPAQARLPAATERREQLAHPDPHGRPRGIVGGGVEG
jgi:hypothetical protein